MQKACTSIWLQVKKSFIKLAMQMCFTLYMWNLSVSDSLPLEHFGAFQRFSVDKGSNLGSEYFFLFVLSSVKTSVLHGSPPWLQFNFHWLPWTPLWNPSAVLSLHQDQLVALEHGPAAYGCPQPHLPKHLAMGSSHHLEGSTPHPPACPYPADWQSWVLEAML